MKTESELKQEKSEDRDGKIVLASEFDPDLGCTMTIKEGQGVIREFGEDYECRVRCEQDQIQKELSRDDSDPLPCLLLHLTPPKLLQTPLPHWRFR